MFKELEQLQGLTDTVLQYLQENGLNIAITIALLIVGYMIAKKLGKAVESMMMSKKIDVTLSRFVGNSAHIVILAFVIMMVLGRLGISITPLVAILGALSLGAGLACLLYTSPSPRDQRGSRMPSSA